MQCWEGIIVKALLAGTVAQRTNRCCCWRCFCWRYRVRLRTFQSIARQISQFLLAATTAHNCAVDTVVLQFSKVSARILIFCCLVKRFSILSKLLSGHQYMFDVMVLRFHSTFRDLGQLSKGFCIRRCHINLYSMLRLLLLYKDNWLLQARKISCKSKYFNWVRCNMKTKPIISN